MVEPARADGTVEVHEFGVGERPSSGHAAVARPGDGLAVRSAKQRRPSRFWTASEYAILPETVSREPLGPLVRKDDWRWFDVVKWVGHALVAAEEFGVTAADAEARRADPNPEVQRLLGGTGEFGPALGLDAAWACNAIRAVGSFAEVWERNLAPLGMERGPNRLWREGGLLYAPPFR